MKSITITSVAISPLALLRSALAAPLSEFEAINDLSARASSWTLKTFSDASCAKNVYTTTGSAAKGCTNLSTAQKGDSLTFAASPNGAFKVLEYTSTNCAGAAVPINSSSSCTGAASGRKAVSWLSYKVVA